MYQLKVIEEFKEAAKQIYVDPTHVAAIYAGLGDAEQTLAWLEKGYQERSSWMIYLNSDARYDWLHANPKFSKLAQARWFRRVIQVRCPLSTPHGILPHLHGKSTQSL